MPFGNHKTSIVFMKNKFLYPSDKESNYGGVQSPLIFTLANIERCYITKKYFHPTG